MSDQAAGSTRCAKEDCDAWAVANSRFCKDRKLYMMHLNEMNDEHGINCFVVDQN
ncbi:hypothetical protein F4818DRAFT_426279 [Hypoxylon cercidicola]|nr:hypothetical protein F4818DRAFT_426279 [Hypoxylon cercidicola]